MNNPRYQSKSQNQSNTDDNLFKKQFPKFNEINDDL